MEKKNILYAEDDIGARELGLMYLNRFLSEVNLEIFNDGDSLEERLQKGPEGIDLVLTDNKMPGPNGSDIIRKYARLPGFENVSFILFHAGYTEIGKQAVRDGAFAYLEKSATSIRELVPLLKRALKIE